MSAVFSRVIPKNYGSFGRVSEEGAAAIFSLMLILIFLCFAALLVDLLRLEQTMRLLQNAADAASLSATIQLNPNPSLTLDPAGEMRAGWRQSKEVAFQALRKNRLPDFILSGTPLSPDSAVSHADATLNDNAGAWSFQGFEFQNLLVRIERGIYYDSVDAAGITSREFASLEGVADCCAHTTCKSVMKQTAYKRCLGADALPSEFVAIGVRVTLSARSMPLYFAGLLGIARGPDTRRISVSAQAPYRPG